MRTVTTNFYSFNELSPEAQKVAIENERERMEEEDSQLLLQWAIDDCSLLEPKHDELVRVFGENYDEKFKRGFLIINNRNVFCDLDSDRIDISNAAEIDDGELFFQWLEIPKEMWANTDYDLTNQGIMFNYDNGDDDPTEEQNQILLNAYHKYMAHLKDVLSRIKRDYECRFEDIMIIEDIDGDECFLESGAKY